VNDHDSQLAAALKAGNARYEARFGRVFLIRAKGRSGYSKKRYLIVWPWPTPLTFYW